jgi:hypothetical protein
MTLEWSLPFGFFFSSTELRPYGFTVTKKERKKKIARVSSLTLMIDYRPQELCAGNMLQVRMYVRLSLGFARPSDVDQLKVDLQVISGPVAMSTCRL